MAIPLPVTQTVINSSAWGIPLTTEVNRMTTEVNRMTPLVVAPTAWTNPTFMNGWVNYGTPYAPVQYRKVGDLAYIRGLMKSGATSAVAFMMPIGFRPPQTLQFPAQAGGLFSFFEVLSSGEVIITAGSNAAFGVMCSYSVTP